MNEILSGLSPYRLLELTFFAGVTYAGFRSAVKQLNGVSARERRQTEIENFRFLSNVITELTYELDFHARKDKGERYLKAGFPEGR